VRRLKARNKPRIVQALSRIILNRKLPPHVVVHQWRIDESSVLTEPALELIDFTVEELRTETGIKIDVK
jgi:hypothetical protein